MKQTAYDFCYLAACAVNGVLPDIQKIEQIDLDELYEISRRHSLSVLTGIVLSDAGVHLPTKWKEEKEKAIRKALLFAAERAKILRFMEEHEIWHLPMKGTVLASLYPRLGMREMVDNDILCDPTRRSEVAVFMKASGYEKRSIGKSHHDIYCKAPIYNFEIHTQMFSETVGKRFTDYYAHIHDRFLLDTNSRYGRLLCDEDFYVHLTAHEYKHAILGGTGLRSLLDRYVFLQKKTVDFDIVERECEILGIADYERATRALCLKVFGDAKCPDLSEQEIALLEKYLCSATHGTFSQGVRSRMKAKYHTVSRFTKTRYIIRRVFPNAAFFEAYSPITQKYKVLIPVVWFYRLVKAICTRRKRIRAEIEIVRRISDD